VGRRDFSVCWHQYGLKQNPILVNDSELQNVDFVEKK